MPVGRHWRIVARASEGGLRGTKRLRGGCRVSGAAWEGRNARKMMKIGPIFWMHFQQPCLRLLWKMKLLYVVVVVVMWVANISVWEEIPISSSDNALEVFVMQL